MNIRRVAAIPAQEVYPCGCRPPFALCEEAQRLQQAEWAAQAGLPLTQTAWRAARAAYDAHLDIRREMLSGEEA